MTTPVCLGALFLAALAPGEAGTVLVATEQSLGELPEGVPLESVSTSPDWRHTVFVVARGGQEAVVLDGVEQKAYDEVLPQTLRFSRNGRRLAYGARAGERCFMVIDGVEGPTFDEVADFAFSPNGKRTAYTGRRIKKAIGFRLEGWFPPVTGWRLDDVTVDTPVVDGVQGKAYPRVWQYHFSPDSRRLAYKVEDRERECFIIDGVAQKPFPEVFNCHFTFSPDSRRFAYAAGVRGGRRMIVDGTEGRLYDLFSQDGPIFSPDGRRLAYKAIRNKPRGGMAWFCVVDDWESRAYDDVSGRSPQFSADGRRIAWEVQYDGAYHLLVDGDELKATGVACDPRWSPDGKRLGFVVKREGRCVMVISGEPGPAYDTVGGGSLNFGPDGRHTVYAAMRGGKWFVVIDGAEGNEYDGVGDITFSPDGKHVAYGARRGDRHLVVVDEAESPSYDGVPGPEVIACPGPPGLRLVWPKGPEFDPAAYHYEAAYGHSPILWGGPAALHTIVLKGRQLVLVRLRIRQAP
jgi:roadblock/LC7 domain-containing protein